MVTPPTWPETPDIHDRGMGPEIRGTRIVMTDIYPWIGKWSPEKIAEWYRLTIPQVQAAVAYIDEHREWVEADMKVLRERAERGNPPEVREKLKGARERLLAYKTRLEQESAAKGGIIRFPAKPRAQSRRYGRGTSVAPAPADSTPPRPRRTVRRSP